MFITSIFERRLNANMRRHKLDVKIAPPKPKPNCRAPVERRVCADEQKLASIVNTGDAQLMTSFLASAVDTLPTVAPSMVGQSASSSSLETISEQLSSAPTTPTTPVAAVYKQPQLVLIAGESATPLLVIDGGADDKQLEAAVADAAMLKAKTAMTRGALAGALHRSGSFESAVFTDSDIDAASNVSFVA